MSTTATAPANDRRERTMKHITARIALALAVGHGLAACSTHVSGDITPEGRAGTVIFPGPETAVLKEGTFPARDAVALVRPGLNKDQIYQLLGRPHFREGFARVREWDYLLHFSQGDGEKSRTCQLKLIYDRHYRVGSIHWRPADCARPPAATAAEIPFVLESDGLFRFGRSRWQDMPTAAHARLREIVGRLQRAKHLHDIDVLAYTDRIGNSAANLALAQARAETVRAFLIAEGIPAGRIRAVGIGSANPVSQCGDLPRAELIDCLAPDRRVEIRARLAE